MFKIKDSKKGIGLVLEGGGSRGAYQIGVVKALYENNINFTAVVGTSIGAINGAYLAQGDFDNIYNMWSTMSFKDLFELDNKKMSRLLNKDLDVGIIRYLSKKLNETIKNGGLDTSKMRDIVSKTIDEEKIRKSDMLFGLVAICLSDRKPEELFIEDIEKGKLVDYIMATSNLPVFKRALVNEKKYLDGGFWDNCPVQMLEKKGYKDAIVIRAHKINRIRGYNAIIKRDNITMHMIEPIDNLGSILNFDTKNLNYLLKYGYYDGLKFIYDYDGVKYYIQKTKGNEITGKIENISYDKIKRIASDLKIKLEVGNNISEELKTTIIPELLKRAKISKTKSLKDAIIRLIEYVAINEEVERFKVYTLNDFINEVKQKDKHKNSNNKAIYEFINDI